MSVEPARKLSRRALFQLGSATAALGLLAIGLRGTKPSLLSLFPAANTMPDTTALLTLGDPRASKLGGTGVRIDHQPVGMDFYERDWPMDRLGRVRYLQGPQSFEVSRVASVMGSLDRDDPTRGIYAWGLNAFPMDEERIPHQLARDRLFQLFAELRKAGWTRYVLPSEPRLAGEQALRYALAQDCNYPLDPAHVPELAQWMQINLHLPYWKLWAGGSYLTLRVIDEPALRNPDKPGVYMFSIDIDSESANFQKYFTEVADMKRWKELIPPEIARLRALRASTEAALQRQGYTIDTTYTDPPILALEPGA